ncbi:hypothetical protein CFD26_108183 [Aspergillus turcosus]|uniref:Thioesterase domain-containing protein n=1 Tax=Aspergillus turcosus TaxID=1245748 RepID=A0A421DEP0_9EURO|nr:hypothetical protein CFD26_108183 [Aspergillus turcosus]
MSSILLLCAAGLAVVLFGPNLKCLPGLWHLRILYILIRKNLNPAADRQALFKPHISTSRAPLFEIDIQLHKTNSSYFADLDESRLALLVRVFPECFSTGKNKMRLAMGGTSCTFFRAIAPFQAYEMRSQVLCWDDKWLYLASYFILSGGGRKLDQSQTGRRQKAPSLKSSPEGHEVDLARSVVIASAITKYCFKSGRTTVAPQQILERRQLLPPGREAEWQARNTERMQIASAFNDLSILRDHLLLVTEE